jgi:hypothetical protein
MGQHATSLVIGGTGMLARATLWLAERSTKTIVVARHASRFAPQHQGLMRIDSNWHASAFRSDITNATNATGPVSTALLWLHTPEPILAWLLTLLPGARTVVVLGSTSGLPTIPNGSFIPVRLGSKAIPGGRRWLTDDEISDAAIAALTDGHPRIAGDLQPL